MAYSAAQYGCAGACPVVKLLVLVNDSLADCEGGQTMFISGGPDWP